MTPRRPAAWRAAVAAAAMSLLGQFPSGRGRAAPDRPSPQPAFGVEVDEIDNAARTHLANAEQFLANRQWDEAVRTLRRLMETDGDQLVPARPAGAAAFARYVTLRDDCQMRLVASYFTAPEALQLYRRRVDPLARQWFEQSEAGDEARWLERLVDEFFASSYGDDALWRLGEIALEQGDYTGAREVWERISPLTRTPESPPSWLGAAPGQPLWLALRGVDLDEHWSELAPWLTGAKAPPSWLAYPDTDLDLGDVRARLTLVSILERSPDRAEVELELLRRLHPDRTGRLGGRTGRLAELLAELLEASRHWPPPATADDWPTFGGSTVRGKVAPREVEIGGGPIWEMALPRRLAAEGRFEPPPYHPIVVAGAVFVRTGARVEDVAAVTLSTGQPAGLLAADRASGAEPLESSAAAHAGSPPFTLSAAAGRLYIRVESPGVDGALEGGASALSASRIAALDLRTEGKLVFDPIRPDGSRGSPAWSFEGAPVSDGARFYAALRRRDVRGRTDAACFDAQTGRLLWRRMICRSPGGGQGSSRTHNLLTLSRGRLYYNTNWGVVAALRALDGRVRWITRYAPARRGELDAGPTRSGNGRPCLAYKDLVIAAPSDSDRVFALDAAVGCPVWVSRAGSFSGATQLLGVGANNLIASGDHLYWIDVRTGRGVGRFPQSAQLAPELPPPSPRGYGRGLLAGDHVYWPTRQAIYVFEQRTRRTPGGWTPIGVRRIELSHVGATGGNLVMAGGVLLIAAADRLYAFNQYGRATEASPAATGGAPRDLFSLLVSHGFSRVDMLSRYWTCSSPDPVATRHSREGGRRAWE